jgi:hypothetical protein
MELCHFVWKFSVLGFRLSRWLLYSTFAHWLHCITSCLSLCLFTIVSTVKWYICQLCPVLSTVLIELAKQNIWICPGYICDCEVVEEWHPKELKMDKWSFDTSCKCSLYYVVRLSRWLLYSTFAHWLQCLASILSLCLFTVVFTRKYICQLYPVLVS